MMLVKPQYRLAVVLHHTSMTTYLTTVANVPLLSIDNKMKCRRICLIDLKRCLTNHILHLLQRYTSKQHIAISEKTFNG